MLSMSYRSKLPNISDKWEEIKFHIVPGTTFPRWPYQFLRRDIRQAFKGTSINMVKWYSHWNHQYELLNKTPQRALDDIIKALDHDKLNILLWHSMWGNICNEVWHIHKDMQTSIMAFTICTDHIINPTNDILWVHQAIQNLWYNSSASPSIKMTFGGKQDTIVPAKNCKIEDIPYKEIPGWHISFLRKNNRSIRELILREIHTIIEK